MRLSRGRNNSTRLHHLHNDIRSNLLRILAHLARVPPVGVDAGPDEKDEVQEEAEKLAHCGCQLGVETIVFVCPERVDVVVLLGAVAKGPSVVVARVVAGALGTVSHASAHASVIRRLRVRRTGVPRPRVV